MNIAKAVLFYLFKRYVLPAIQKELEAQVTNLADNLIKSRYNATTVDDIEDIKFYARDTLRNWSESWTGE